MRKKNKVTTLRDRERPTLRLCDHPAAGATEDSADASRSRKGNWSIYAAAAGSALAMATSANANILYCGVSNNYCHTGGAPILPEVSVTNGQAVFAIPLIGNNFFDLKGQAAADFGMLSVLGVGHVRAFAASSSSQLLKRFASGAPISGHSARNSAEIVRLEAASVEWGLFQPGLPAGFAGVEITGLGSHGNQTDYGWIRLLVTDNPATGFPQTLRAVDWAIDETPGENIDAGQTGQATPEPDLRPLAMLAAGALGVIELRRRRQARSQA